jgi:uncharacterized membrane protein
MSFIILFLFALAVWALVSAREAGTLAAELQAELRDVKVELRHRLERLELSRLEKVVAPVAPAPVVEPVKVAPPPLPVLERSPVLQTSPPLPEPPPLPKQPEKPVVLAVAPVVKAEAKPRVSINWEQFLGVKMFAWVGGLLAFLALAFFVKLSFERGWISNEMRVLTSYAIGLAALMGGKKLHANARYHVLAQTLCATGVLMLYGTTYAAQALYGFIGHGTSFVLMCGITAVAFVLAVRLEAQVIAVLGMLGGFLTPILCSSGRDNALGLFSYIMLLDAGILAVVKYRRWYHLVTLAAVCTLVMELAWCVTGYRTHGYGQGAKTWLVVAVLGGFPLLFAAGARWLEQVRHTHLSTWLLCVPAMIMAFHWVDEMAITTRPSLMIVLVVMVLGALAWQAWGQGENGKPIAIGLGAAFVHLSCWVIATREPQHLVWLGWAVGLTVVAFYLEKKQGWRHLLITAASGTALVQIFWFVQTLAQGRASLVLPEALLVFTALPLGYALIRMRSAEVGQLILMGSGMVVAFGLLVTELHLAWVYVYVLALVALVMWLVWQRPELHLAHSVIAAATFVHLAVWTIAESQPGELMIGLGLYLLFGVLHTAFALLLVRKNPQLSGSGASWMPLMSIVLMLLPLLRSGEVSFMIWPAFMLANLVVMAVSWVRGRLVTVFLGMALTMFGAFVWMNGLPSAKESLGKFVGVLGGVSLVFVTAASLLMRKFIRQHTDSAAFSPVALPVSAALMPFALLCMAITEFSEVPMLPVFGLALLLSVFLIGLSAWVRQGILTLVAFGSTLAVLVFWHLEHYTTEQYGSALAWYLGFTLLFAACPFVLRARFEQDIWPWIASALSGLGTFLLVQDVVMPMAHKGLLPLLYALPPLVSLWALRQGTLYQRQLAWFGAVALFFITLIFPYELTRQWITLSWALEGAALIWLYTKTPQRGLVWVGLALLATVFVRLGLNPAIMISYERMERVFFNWHLAVYGVAVVSLIAAARWLREPMLKISSVPIKPVLYGMAGWLAFVWINVEITDAFTPAGQAGLLIDLQNASIGRRMTYSIAWAAYALVLIIVGFLKQARFARYAGIALMSVTILKVFFRDLATLDSVYRIAALAAVAVMALAASFVYQRWFDRGDKPANPPAA